MSTGGFEQAEWSPCTEMGYKVGSRLRELLLAVRGSQEAGFTQPSAHVIAHLCSCNCVHLNFMCVHYISAFLHSLFAEQKGISHVS